MTTPPAGGGWPGDRPDRDEPDRDRLPAQAGPGERDRDTGAGGASGAPTGGDGPGGGPAGHPGGPPASGLRNPARSARAVGAAALSAEAVTLLLAIAPLATLGGRRTGAAITLVVVLAVFCVVLVGLLRHRWAWYAALVPQLALIAGGLLNGALAIVGVLFLLLWLFVMYVRRTVLNPPRRG